MDFDEYQKAAVRTAAMSDRWDMRRLVFALGLSGETAEAGELFIGALNALALAGKAGLVAETVKKEVGHGHAENREKIAKEIGDVLWYAATLADDYGLSLSAIARQNIEKLRARYPDGFSTERSINRHDPALD